MACVLERALLAVEDGGPCGNFMVRGRVRVGMVR